MTDQKVLNEIEKAILEEQEKELLEAQKAEKAVENDDTSLPKYLTDNTVKLPLSDFLILYQQAQLLDRLLNGELDTNKEKYTLLNKKE